MRKDKPKFDLHAITRAYGVENVAKVIGVKPDTLAHKRAGFRMFRVSELYLISLAYPELDIAATVRRCGAARCARDMRREQFDE
jgi:hypothetical protein